MIIPDVVLIQLSSWGWAHSCSKHVEDSNKHTIEETVCQVGYLPELYEDAWSEKYIKKKTLMLFWTSLLITVYHNHCFGSGSTPVFRNRGRDRKSILLVCQGTLQNRFCISLYVPGDRNITSFQNAVELIKCFDSQVQFLTISFVHDHTCDPW